MGKAAGAATIPLNAMTDVLARLLNTLPAFAVSVFPRRVVIRAMQLMAQEMGNSGYGPM